tara:strand:- start:60615 stop:61748 length:1134 start_codon:yes stop_codon:yes gene_type:complete
MYRTKSVVAMLLVVCATSIQAQETHIVDLAGTGDFVSIHDAVDAASAGDTIRVQPDQYAFTANLGPVSIDKKLVIIGSGYMPVEEGGTELIDIPGTGFFDITGSGDGTVIKGFRIQGATDFLDTDAGASGITIENNLFIGGTSIIAFAGSQDTVRSNIFVGTGTLTVFTSGASTQITNNIFSQSTLGFSAHYLLSISSSSGAVIAYNNFMNNAGTSGYTIRINTGAPEIYSNGFANHRGPSGNLSNAGTGFYTNNGFYGTSETQPFGLNTVLEDPSFTSFDPDNEVLDLEAIDDFEFDLTLAEGSEWINAGRTGTPYLDTDGSRSDIGIYAGPNPFDDGRGAPTVPVVIQFQVNPTTVSPSGTITITATGRIGSGSN